MEFDYTMTEHHIWLKTSLLKKIQLEGFKSRQSIWSALINFEQDGILVSTPNINQRYKGAWRPLVSPKNYQMIGIGTESLWWRFTEPKNIELTASPQVPTSTINSSYTEQNSFITINPWEYWVRSPEQASLRRALITEQKHALCLTAPRGSGMTSALSSAICDWLEAQSGECIFITRSPRKARSILQALSSEHERVHLLSPHGLLKIILGQNITQTTQNNHLSFLEEGSILADALSVEEWSQWSQWALKQKEELGPWLDWIAALRRLIIKRVVVLGSPSTNPSSVRERLTDLPDNWLAGLANLGQQLWESEHLECLRALEEVNDVNWPWPTAKALVIDDCLSMPWPLIYKTLKFADEYLGVSGRKWSLMLASSGEGGQSVTGVRLDEIETLVSGVLGRHIIPLNLHFSERLPQDKILGIRSLMQERIKSTPQQNAFQLSSSLHLSQRSKIDASSPLWLVSEDHLDDDLNLQKLFETCVATPGAFVLDLSPRPSVSLQSRLNKSNFVTEQMLNKIITTHQLADREVQWLIAYRGHHSQAKQALIPEVLNHLEETDFQGLYYLLTRSPTPLIWIGDFELNIRVKKQSLEEALLHISRHSPWYGQEFFHRLKKAKTQYIQGEVGESLKNLEQCLEAAKQILSSEQVLEIEQTLINIYRQRLSLAFQKEEWSKIDKIIISLIKLHKVSSGSKTKRSPITISKPNEEPSNHLISKELLDSQSYAVIQHSMSELISSGEESFRSQNLSHIEKLIGRFEKIMSLGIASVVHEQIKGTCLLWSERILALPVPQATLQKALIELLIKTSPSSLEYQLLKPAYQQSPTPLVLSQIAMQILDLDEAVSEIDQQRRIWTYKHLRRWLAYLLEPHTNSPLPHLASATIAIGFALVAAKEKAWSLSQNLSDKSLIENQFSSLDPKWSSEPSYSDEQQIEDEHRRRQWRNEWQSRFKESALSEQVQELRQKGDLLGSIAWYQKHNTNLPHELKVLNSLIRHLDELGKFWHSLSPSERAVLEQLWTQMKEKG